MQTLLAIISPIMPEFSHFFVLFVSFVDKNLLVRNMSEPVVQSEPFVMNSVEEIEQAFRDYRNGVLTL